VILVDSNILIDLFTNDAKWMLWSRNALSAAIEQDQLVVNQIVIAEVAPQFPHLQDFNKWIATFDISIVHFENDAAYCGGMAFRNYRKMRKGLPNVTKSMLPDFLIGGHAQILGASVITRDPRFYRTYFPSVPLITPSKDDHD
jgi:predicted nucleic acid-binding protein